MIRKTAGFAMPAAIVTIVAVVSIVGVIAFQWLSSGPHSFETKPPGSALPSDETCATLVRRDPWEPRPENTTANNTTPTAPIAWGGEFDYWSDFRAKRDRVTGNFTGTTDEILQWGACKWGLDEDLLRSLAYQESLWRQSARGDFCPDGTPSSFGLLQVRNSYCDGRLNHGGYPATLESTAVNVDIAGAILRSCFEGDFYDGGDWLYGGDKVVGDLWGCVGFYYSGKWYDDAASTYIEKIRRILREKPWLAWGHPDGRGGRAA